MSFKEFLETQEDRVRAQGATREDAMNRWRGSITALNLQISAWLKEFDPKGLLMVKDRLIELSEGSIGTYDVPALEIWMGGKRVSIEPVARHVMGPRWKPADGAWSGRVDIVGDPYRHEIYRFSGSDQSESWYIRDTQNYVLKPFTKESFDSALVDVFS